MGFKFFRGALDGTFLLGDAIPLGDLPPGDAVVDVDGDAVEDLVVSSRSSQSLAVVHVPARGRLHDRDEVSLSESPRWLHLAHATNGTRQLVAGTRARYTWYPWG